VPVESAEAESAESTKPVEATASAESDRPAESKAAEPAESTKEPPPQAEPVEPAPPVAPARAPKSPKARERPKRSEPRKRQTPKAAPAPASRARAAPPAAKRPASPDWQTCRVRLWHGYIKKQFYAEAPGTGAWVAQSPFFRIEKGQTLDGSQQAADAFDALLDELISDGWEIVDRRPDSWQTSLRRRTRGARTTSRQPVKQPRG
jgi:hypothetical protein